MWAEWRAHPETRPWATLDDLPLEGQEWVLMQDAIDDGVLHCSSCDTFGRHTYCGDCGERFIGPDLNWRLCHPTKCGTWTTTDFCPVCGAEMVSKRRKAFEAGTLDLVEASANAARIMREVFGVGVAEAPASSPPTRPTMGSAIVEAFR